MQKWKAFVLATFFCVSGKIEVLKRPFYAALRGGIFNGLIN